MTHLLRLFLAALFVAGLAVPAHAQDAKNTRVLTAPVLQPQGDLAYLQALQAQAAQRRLAERPEWHDLLHYRRQPLTRQLRSLADDADFFNAALGKTDPAAELAATLAAMFDPAPNRSGQQAARCRFPARWLWLREQLAIDGARLPTVDCTAWRSWRESLHTRSVSLVFPAAYVNSPASMYGHTFLRLDPDEAAADQPLLSYTISYAAEGTEADGMMFALRGLLGLYPGIVTNAPYYMRIRDYTHLENRDIWEYKLALTPAEIDRLLAHAWELGHTLFDYYFFDENCSYQLLSLLDVARPGLNLSSHFTWWTIPVDTVRETVAQAGLVLSHRYRPSNSSELAYRAAQLNEDQVQQALAWSKGAPLPAELKGDALDTVRTLELAERAAVWRASRGDYDDDALAKVRTPLLAARARLPAAPALVVPTPAVAPEQGHRTARLDLLAGQRDGQAYWKLAVRPSYHDVTDPEAGYQRGAQIQLGSLALSQQAGRGLRLDHFTPVDILSISPQSAVGGGPSWKVRGGVTRAWGLPSGDAPLAWGLNGGPGKAWELGSADRSGRHHALAYAFMDNQLWRDASHAGTPWRLGSGLQAGVLLDLGAAWRVQLDATERRFLGRGGREQGLLVHQRYQLNADSNLVLRCEWHRRDSLAPQHGCEAGWQHYW